MSLEPGQRIRRYVLETVLARGGMGMVWRAFDTRVERRVALKVVLDGASQDAQIEARFRDEARRHARMHHPNIVPVIDVFDHEAHLCMVMELIDGQSLASLLQQAAGHRLDTTTAVAIMADVLGALDYAHRMGVVHRDVKPSNILLDAQGRAHVADFGIALAVGEARRTRAGLVVGTSLYMSPEQIRTPRSIDHRTDVYSAGCVLYEMLTGRPPFVPPPRAAGDFDFQVRLAHVSQTPMPPRDRVGDIAPAVSALVLRALQKDPDRRISGCGEFMRLLTDLPRATRWGAVCAAAARYLPLLQRVNHWGSPS